jgi:hypothetical protein
MLGIFSRAGRKSTKASLEVILYCLHDFSSVSTMFTAHMHFALSFWQHCPIVNKRITSIAVALLLSNVLHPLQYFQGKKPLAILCVTCALCRYCREPNAKPLWALSSGCPSNADIPSCSSCKGPLCYEFQVGQISSL